MLSVVEEIPPSKNKLKSENIVCDLKVSGKSNYEYLSYLLNDQKARHHEMLSQQTALEDGFIVDLGLCKI